jgi:DNA-binding Lrp family transcriptional regulator
MGLESVKARCMKCGMCSDDLVRTDKGIVNRHEHAVEVFATQGMLEPGEVLTKVGGLTPESYLKEVSKLDAELLVSRISAYVEKKYQIPLPKSLLNKLIEEVLVVLREMAVEAEAKDRKVQKRAQLQQQVAEKLKKAKKPKEPEDEEPLT